MKLLRYGPAGAEKPGLVDAGGVVRDLSGHVDDVAGDALSDAGLARLRALDPTGLPAVAAGARLGPCVAGTGKFICIGLNYADHAAESGAAGAARAGDLHEGHQRDLRPERRRADSAQLGKDRLGGRTRRGHRDAAPSTSPRPRR